MSMAPEIGLSTDFLARVLDAARAMGKERTEMAGDVPGVEGRSLRRGFIVSRRLGDSIAIHEWLKSEDEHLHDHPWDNVSVILDVGYFEITPKGRFWRAPGDVIFRKAEEVHRIELDPEKPPARSLFIRSKHRRNPGIRTSNGWVPVGRYMIRQLKADIAESEANEEAFGSAALASESMEEGLSLRTKQLRQREQTRLLRAALEHEEAAA
jgi:hypothetical protein